MKDGRSDCAAIKQIKLQRRSGEWAARHETRLFTQREQPAFIKTQKAGSEEQMTFN